MGAKGGLQALIGECRTNPNLLPNRENRSLSSGLFVLSAEYRTPLTILVAVIENIP